MLLGFTHLKDRVSGALEKTQGRILFIFLFFCALQFIFQYWIADGFEGTGTWRAWSDQKTYYLMASDLRKFQLNKDHFFFGPGYPALGAIFSTICPIDDFLLFDLMSYILVMGLIYRALILLTQNVAFSLVSVTALALNGYLLEYIMTPWSSTVTALAFSFTLYICSKRKRTTWDYWILGLSTGLVFSARYIDLILWIPLFFTLVHQEWKLNPRAAFWRLGPGLLTGIALVMITLLINKALMGGFFTTPYVRHGHGVSGLNDASMKYYWNRLTSEFQDIIGHLYGQWFNPGPAGKGWPSLFQRTPLLWLGLPGIAWLCLGRPAQDRVLFVPACMGAAVFTFFYGMHPGTAPGCVKFGSLHYFKAIALLLFLAGAVFLYDFLTLLAPKISSKSS